MSTVRITVTYPATDGSMPENVDVEWTLEPGDAVAKDAIVTVLDRLLMAPSRRTVVGTPPGDSVRGRGFRAITDIPVGRWAATPLDRDGVLEVGENDLEHDGWSHRGVTATDLKAGDLLAWGASDDLSVKTMTWRKAEQ